MAARGRSTKNEVMVYPVGTSIFLITTAILLTVIDLTFLTDVIGQVLRVSNVPAFLISTGLGMIGLSIMTHEGNREAHGHTSKTERILNYTIWLLLGIAFATIRLFEKNIVDSIVSGTRLGIDTIFKFDNVGENVIFAPLMLLLYLATGLLIKDGVKNLQMNPEFKVWSKSFKKWIKNLFSAKDVDPNLEFMHLIRSGDKALSNNDFQEAINNFSDAKTWGENNGLGSEKIDLASSKLKDAKNSQEYYKHLLDYEDAFNKYKLKEKTIKDNYETIDNNINFVLNIDAQEESFEKSVKPGLIRIIQETIYSTQNTVALLVSKKTKVNIQELTSAISDYNKIKHDKAQK